MGKTYGNVETGERIYCVIELAHTFKGPEAGIRAFVSLAGRPDPLTKLWKARHGMLTTDQLRDLGGWVHDQLTSSTIGFIGCQEMLPQA